MWTRVQQTANHSIFEMGTNHRTPPNNLLERVTTVRFLPPMHNRNWYTNTWKIFDDNEFATNAVEPVSLSQQEWGHYRRQRSTIILQLVLYKKGMHRQKTNIQIQWPYIPLRTTWVKDHRRQDGRGSVFIEIIQRNIRFHKFDEYARSLTCVSMWS